MITLGLGGGEGRKGHSARHLFFRPFSISPKRGGKREGGSPDITRPFFEFLIRERRKTDQYNLLAYILSGTKGEEKGGSSPKTPPPYFTGRMSGEIVLIRKEEQRQQQYLAGFGQWVTVFQGVIERRGKEGRRSL